MLDDIKPTQTGSQKVIQPLTKPEKPSLSELEAKAPEAKVIASGDLLSNTTSSSDIGGVVINGVAASNKHKNGFFKLGWSLGRFPTIILTLALCILLGGGVAAAVLSRPPQIGGVHKSVKPPKPAPKITTVANSLSGLQVDASINQRPVTGVMIENSEDARPQSGLDQAGVVFEAIAEGGITRFLALFQDTQPDYIGPVRSARPYYVQWCMGFDCALAHAGGSPEALQNIRDWGTKDLNDTPGIFWRINSRYAPHNLYTSTAKLNELEGSRGYGAPTLTGFARKTEQPYKTTASTPAASKTKTAPDSRTPANSINFAISSGIFNAHFDYDAASNSYLRSQGGAAHMVVNGAGAQTQIKPKVVAAIITPYSVAADKHSQYGVTGSGQAYIFQDGTVTVCTWNKADIKSQLQFTDAAGKPIPLNPGQTWVTALATGNLVTYQ